MEIHGNLVDIHQRRIYSAKVVIDKGKIAAISPNTHRGKGFILPGFVDPHLHLASTLLTPSAFARIAVRHGTVAALVDPEPMATILGISGLEALVTDAKKVPFKFYFAAPAQCEELFPNADFPTLCEVSKPLSDATLALAKKHHKHIDGYLPDLFGEALKKIKGTGIETDHSCSTLSQARERRACGLKVLIQEGSLFQQFNTLFPLIPQDLEGFMLCSGYLSPDALILGHINLLVRRAIQKGMDPIDAITLATKNPAHHYDLNVGLLRVGDPADCIIVEDLNSLRVLETYIGGHLVFKEECLIPLIPTHPINTFKIPLTTPETFALNGEHALKLAVISRTPKIPPHVQPIHNFGLKTGAIATSIHFHSDGIIALGASDEDLSTAVNALIKHQGGLVVCDHNGPVLLPLPVAGLLSSNDPEHLARHFSDFNEAATRLGLIQKNPFLALSNINQVEGRFEWVF